jgi:small-conductance mechanosensitive channel
MSMNGMLGPLQDYLVLVVTVVIAFVVAKLLVRLVAKAANKLQLTGRFTPDLAEFVGTILRTAVWLALGLFVLTQILLVFGLQDILMRSVLSFLAENAARIGVMILLAVVGYVAIRILGIVFAEYKRRTKLQPITVDLLYSLARYLVYALVVVLVFTNILVMAGLQTLAGTLVTLFAVLIGLVVSFAATGSIGNALSGLVIMSWRPYGEGDRVEIGNGTYGDVMEVDVMFTKIRTIKDEIIHIPNSQVLGNKIINYSALPKVIVHQEVTIGYEVSRKRVEQLLLEAAKGSEGLLPEPEPFVLVRNLYNSFVAYEVNAYTDRPSELVRTYSSLMKSILDRFERAGIEVLSPEHVTVHRSGLDQRGRASRAAGTHGSENPRK